MHRGRLNAGGRSGSRQWAGSAAAVVFALAVASAAAFSGNDQTLSKSDPLTPTASPASRIRDSFFDLRFSMRGVQQAASLSEIKLAKVLFAPKPTYESDNRLVETDVAQAEPSEVAQAAQTTIPLPRPRPTEANAVARDVARVIESDRTDDPTILDKLSGMFKYRLTLASLAPGDGIFAPKLDLASLGYDNETAVYDISSHAVYLPNGAKFEAHSGLGEARDDLSHVSEHKVGPTPPAVYDLKPREQLFHGVQALRMNPVEGSALGRTGLLVHSYMLGPNGDSNGCVSVKDYDRFLAAYQRGDFKRLAVVPNIAALAKQSSL
jgi:Protein of unknown function (DUF2778)